MLLVSPGSNLQGRHSAVLTPYSTWVRIMTAQLNAVKQVVEEETLQENTFNNIDESGYNPVQRWECWIAARAF